MNKCPRWQQIPQQIQNPLSHEQQQSGKMVIFSPRMKKAGDMCDTLCEAKFQQGLFQEKVEPAAKRRCLTVRALN